MICKVFLRLFFFSPSFLPSKQLDLTSSLIQFTSLQSDPDPFAVNQSDLSSRPGKSRAFEPDVSVSSAALSGLFDSQSQTSLYSPQQPLSSSGSEASLRPPGQPLWRKSNNVLVFIMSHKRSTPFGSLRMDICTVALLEKLQSKLNA